MPLPKPSMSEDEETFLTRCMSDEVMIQEFGKLEQRFAVCNIQWETFEDEMEEEDDEEESEKIEVDSLSVILDKFKKQTNFPQQGDDKTVSLSNSKYDLFPIEFAERIKEKYPKVWALGGNILGNEQYKHLYEIRKKNISTEQLTPRQEEAIRLREAWSARHYDNSRPAGVIAQIKWHTVGSRGLEYMKNLMNEEIEKRYGGE
jgi:hypothetical protein